MLPLPALALGRVRVCSAFPREALAVGPRARTRQLDVAAIRSPGIDLERITGGLRLRRCGCSGHHAPDVLWLTAPVPSLPQASTLAAPPPSLEADKGASFDDAQVSGLGMPTNHEPGWALERFSKSRA